jgi:hypothetical protein
MINRIVPPQLSGAPQFMDANLRSRAVVSHSASRIFTRRERVADHGHHQFRTF